MAELNGAIPTDIMAELRAATDRAARGVRDPKVMRLACERTGELDVAVNLIREGRDES
jgi:hypothetical protein